MGRGAVNAIRVVRMSPDVAARLTAAPPDAGRVHSVFERALNVAWHDGRLLTLQGPGRLLAPFAAALMRLPRSDAVRPGFRVWRRGDTLALDGLLIDWRGAATAETAMPESAAGPGRALSRLLARPPAGCGPGLSSATGRRAQSRLAAGLSHRDPEAFLDGALGLAGLGEGLTPAGDDCLVGALAVVHRFARSWLHANPEIGACVARTSAAATTDLAREFVAHALAGHFADSLIDLMTAESVDGVRRAATRLLDSGATSGADTLCGIRLALAALDASRP